MMLAYIALGSNLGDKLNHVESALHHISELPNTSLLRQSSWHDTDPVGLPDQAEPFINGVAEIETTMLPQDLMKALLNIENKLGRTRNHALGYQSRTIDLDLLLYGGLIITEPGLTLPHPYITQRLFVLNPLSELCPEKVIPGTNLTVMDAVKLTSEMRNT